MVNSKSNNSITNLPDGNFKIVKKENKSNSKSNQKTQETQKTQKTKLSIKDKLKYLKSLRIPPNWKNVKVSYNPLDKIQAIGEDQKGRKQYIYHPLWTQFSKETKYSKVNAIDFDKFLSVINTKSKFNRYLTKEYLIANMFILMKDLNIRVGNEIYLAENDSIGLTTMRKSNYKKKTGTLEFKGKKGVFHEKKLSKNHIAFIERVLRYNKMGQELFRYYSRETNEMIKILSQDLNDFLKIHVDPNMSTKDIRTYCANKIFEEEIEKIKNENPEIKDKKLITLAVKLTAEKLGNTPKVCRDSYINPEIILKYS